MTPLYFSPFTVTGPCRPPVTVRIARTLSAFR